MKRTSYWLLLALGFIGALLGFALDIALVSSGAPLFQINVMLPIAWVLLLLLLIVLAQPVRRAVRDGKGSLNPFGAVRLLALAKAVMMVAALSAGFALGLVIFALSRSVVPDFVLWMGAALTLLTSLGLLGGALYAESVCVMRKGDDDDDDSGAEPSGNPADS